jgi:hypothetical protein
MWKVVGWVLPGVVLTVLPAGCSEQTTTTPQNAQAQRLGGVAKAAAYDQAKVTLREFNFRIAEENSERGLIRSAPNAETIAGGTGRIRDQTVNYPNRIRRTATLEVIARGDSVELLCKVLVERLDTSDHQVFRREHGTGDVPTDTPIQEEGGVTSRQNEVWTLVRRDRQMERQIMAAWAERLGGSREAP